MSFDFQSMRESKRDFRQKLAARPLAEKLRLLDALRARAIAIRRASPAVSNPGMVVEAPGNYRPGEHH
jgi:hypothetical protein